MEQKIDFSRIDPQTLDPKQEEELFASLSDEELADVAGGSYVTGGHVCGSIGRFVHLEDVKYDFEIGTRVQVTRDRVGWASWNATIIDRKAEQRYFYRDGEMYCILYKVRFDNYSSDYDDWYPQERLYI